MRKGALALGLLCISLLCSGFSYSGRDSHVTLEVSEDYVTESEDFGVIKLDGKFIQLPCKVSLFMDLGYDVSDDVDKIFPAKTESYGVNLYDTKGRLLKLFVRNDDSNDHSVEDCWAWSVYYEPCKDVSCGYLDFSISGVTPDGDESLFVEKLGLPGHSMEWQGVKSVLWNSSKNEYRVDIDYSSDGIQKMQLTADVPNKKLESASKRYYSAYYEEHTLSGTEETKSDEFVPSDGEDSGIPTLIIWIVVGIPVLIIVSLLIAWLAAVRVMHKQRMAEIDRDILNTPIENIDSDLEEKYKT